MTSETWEIREIVLERTETALRPDDLDGPDDPDEPDDSDEPDEHHDLGIRKKSNLPN